MSVHVLAEGGLRLLNRLANDLCIGIFCPIPCVPRAGKKAPEAILAAILQSERENYPI